MSLWHEPKQLDTDFDAHIESNYKHEHPSAEVISVSNQPVVKDVYKAKQKSLLALVASIPVIAGLIASVVLSLKPQDLRRQADEPVQVLAEGVCVENEAVLQVGVKPIEEVDQVTAVDLQTGVKLVYTQFNHSGFTVKPLKTGRKHLNPGIVRFEIYSHTMNLIVEEEYAGFACD